MSHNVKITNIKITNLDYVESAVAELNEELGLNWVCEYDSEIRGWAGNTTKVKLAIKTQDRYDIGFIDNHDGTFTPIYEDMYSSPVRADYEAEVIAGVKEGVGRGIGKLLQRINVITAEVEAAQCGYSTQREYDKETGIMNLLVMN